MSQSGVLSWSQTAASNASADPSVNFAEGMAPSAVNDSARALMASVAKWRDDIAGAIVTTGTSTAYSVTSYQVEVALTAGYVIAFNPHTTNGATVTLNVDGLGAKPLRSAPGVELSAGVLIQGTPYVATYFTSNSGEWILQSFYGNPYGVPVGAMIPYVGGTAPNSNFVLPYGQPVSRTAYSTLFGICGTSFGAGDGSTTFNLPDMRGRAVFGKRDMGGTDSTRITVTGSGVDGTAIGATGGVESVTLTSSQVPATALTINTVSLGNLSVNGVQYAWQNINGGFLMQTGGSQAATASATATPYVSVPSFTPTGTVAGGGALHTNLPPAIIMPYILRII